VHSLFDVHRLIDVFLGVLSQVAQRANGETRFFETVPAFRPLPLL
jgi:hypothetical protein